MGRKRLLSILAGVIAAVGLATGPAVAQISLDGGGISVQVDLGVASTDTTISGDGVTGDTSVAGQDLDEVTDTVTSTVDAVTRRPKDPVEGGAPSEPTPDAPSAGGSEPARDSGGTSDGQRTERSGKVEAAGDAQQARPDPAREQQVAALGALRRDLALHGSAPRGGSPVVPGIIGPPSPDGSVSSFAAPQVAPPEVAPGVPSWSQSDDAEAAALLATSPIERAAADVPLLLKLLAGGLVLGSAAMWNTAREELQRPRTAPRAG